MNNRRRIFLLLPFIVGILACVVVAQTPPPPPDFPVAGPRLSPAQLKAIKSIRAESEKKAAPLALQLAAVVKRIYENMLSEKEDAVLRRRLGKEMDRIAAQLLAIKGQSIRETVGVLTPEQRSLVRDEMRKPGAPADLSELIARIFGVPEK